MNTMKRSAMAVLAGAIALAAGVSAKTVPHEVTYLGTVTSVEGNALHVMVVDERTQSQSAMTFRLTADTKFYRGDELVAVADAHLTQGERCAVTINSDVPGNNALTVRLPEHAHADPGLR